ncbi:hypothetical protein Tco_1003710 [Tanacetum coccineum]|uniref:Uncharacterized protein n=1 Tax=Tanacetum coccineum TaxID=301880 RepID=A0ABQ5FBQ1_9ASTR
MVKAQLLKAKLEQCSGTIVAIFYVVCVVPSAVSVRLFDSSNFARAFAFSPVFFLLLPYVVEMPADPWVLLETKDRGDLKLDLKTRGMLMLDALTDVGVKTVNVFGASVAELTEGYKKDEKLLPEQDKGKILAYGNLSAGKGWKSMEEYVLYQDDTWEEPSLIMNISSISEIIKPTFKGRLKAFPEKLAYLTTPPKDDETPPDKEATNEEEGPKSLAPETPFTSHIYQPSKSSSVPFPSRLKKQNKDDEREKFLPIFKHIQINLSFLEALNQIPKGAKLEHEHVVQRTFLTGFLAQSVRFSNTDALNSPYLLVIITEMSQSKQHERRGEERRDKNKRLDHLKQDQTIVVIKRFSKRKKVFKERKKTEKFVQREEVVPKVDDVSLVDGIFDGAFGGDGEEDVVMGKGVAVTSSSLEILTKSCLGGIMVSLIFLEGLEEEA